MTYIPYRLCDINVYGLVFIGILTLGVVFASRGGIKLQNWTEPN